MSENSSSKLHILELEADNRRLRRLLDQQDAPGDLRHRLRNTVAIMRTIVRKSAETKQDFETYVAHLEDRLDALMRAQAAADERGSVELSNLLADELLYYGVSEGDRAHLTGPEVELQPRAGQVLALAVHELAVNAMEHGALGASTGHIEVAWGVAKAEPYPWLTLTWKELAATEVFQPSRSGFGTEVLTRTLQYELKADTSLVFEQDGLRCTIRLPLTERIGQIAVG